MQAAPPVAVAAAAAAPPAVEADNRRPERQPWRQPPADPELQRRGYLELLTLPGPPSASFRHRFNARALAGFRLASFMVLVSHPGARCRCCEHPSH